MAYLQAGWKETVVPTAGIEDGVEGNAPHTNKKLVQAEALATLHSWALLSLEAGEISTSLQAQARRL
jgi:hypothetical protein